MCHSADARPPIRPVVGAAVTTEELVLTAADGNRLLAFSASGSQPQAPALVILPDVRGLHPFYQDLAVRFAEHGHDAVVIDYFGRTAGTQPHPPDFPFQDHVEATTFEGVKADTGAGVAHLRAGDAEREIFTVGFCFGGSNSWHQAANGHGLAGAIGFYGHPNRERPQGARPVVERVGEVTCPILALMGGADPSIPLEEVDRFRAALAAAGIPHEVVVYSDAPHSFFDRQFEDFADACSDAWDRVLRFIREPPAAAD